MTLKSKEGIMLPYSSKHERIESRQKIIPKGPNVKAIFVRRWKKFALSITVAIALSFLYVVARKEMPGDFQYIGGGMNAINKHDHGTDTSPNNTLYAPSSSAATALSTNTIAAFPASATGAIHPTGFESDPDRSTTTYCTVSHDHTKPIVQYALVLHIGLDTPPRMYTYKFNNCKAFPMLEYVHVGQRHGAFKHYIGLGLETAATTLTRLLDGTTRVIPRKLHHTTLLSVKLDASLRNDKALSPWKDYEVIGAIEQSVAHPFRLHTVQYMDDERTAVLGDYINGPFLSVAIEMLVGNLGRQLIK